MHLRRLFEERALYRYLFVLFAAVTLSACGEVADAGSPVTITNNPLAERIEARSLEQASGVDDDSPEALAFADADEIGAFIRFNIDTGPSGTGIFAGPGRGYQEVDRLAAGVEVIATGTQTGEWAFIMYGETEGWVNTRRLSLEDIPEQELFVSTRTIEETVLIYGVRGGASGVNIRASASANGTLIISAPRGSEMVGTGRTDRHWVELTFEGRTGWASGNFVEQTGSRTITRVVEGGLAETPTTSPPATRAPSRSSAPAPTAAPATTAAPTTTAPASSTAAPGTGEDAPGYASDTGGGDNGSDSGNDGTGGNGGNGGTGGNGGNGGTGGGQPPATPETTAAPATTAAPVTPPTEDE